jgi:hypothetical protein
VHNPFAVGNNLSHQDHRMWQPGRIADSEIQNKSADYQRRRGIQENLPVHAS